MAQCAYCRAEIELCDDRVPICVKCSDRRAAEGKPSKTWLRVRVTLNKAHAKSNDCCCATC